MVAVMEPARERLERHLREAHLRDDRDRVAFWTNALESWERPIPDYARSELNQFSLKERAGADIRESVRDHDIRDSIFAPKKGGHRGRFRG